VSAFIGHPADLSAVMERLTRAAMRVGGVEQVPAPSTIVAELARDDVMIELRFWTDSRRSDFIATTSAVRQAVYHALTEAGIYPTNPSLRIVVPGEIEAWRKISRPDANP
jgi:small-conductance mechanosensitive channel